MSVFGTGEPKFITVTGATTVLLDESTIDTQWTETNILEHQSTITGKRNYISSGSDGFGDYSNFNVTVYLYKYSSPSTKFAEIVQHNHKDVYFYPHRDGVAVKDAASADVEFHITDMSLSYLNNTDFDEVLNITFKSKTYTDLGNSVKP